METQQPPHVLVVGGGYVGLYTALRLQRRLRLDRAASIARQLWDRGAGRVTGTDRSRPEARVTVVDPRSYMTYQPFLPEAGAGSVEPRHVVVPLRRVLPQVHVVNGTVLRVEHGRKTAVVRTLGGEDRELGYDLLVMAPGSVARTLPIPGLAERGIGFKSVAEAIYLRNHVLAQLDAAASDTSPQRRRRALTFVFVGGGYAGIEALAELEDMARDAAQYYDIAASAMRWILVEASNRVLPEVSPEMQDYAVRQLRARGIDIRLGTRLQSCVDGRIVLDDGDEFEAETLVWTAGVKANPMLRACDLPLDDKGNLKATAYLTVEGVPDAFTAGDCARVPDLSKPEQEQPAFTGPSAQHAVRQARRLGDNIVASLRGEPMAVYRHAYAGSVASLGLHKGVADVYGVKVKGYPAWFMHRTYHLSRVPTLNRKARVAADWTLALFFQRETVSLGSFQSPRADFEQAASDGVLTGASGRAG